MTKNGRCKDIFPRGGTGLGFSNRDLFQQNLKQYSNFLCTLIMFILFILFQCKIGAVVAVGMYAMGKDEVSWGLIGKIALSWVITLPIAGGIAALATFIFKETL